MKKLYSDSAESARELLDNHSILVDAGNTEVFMRTETSSLMNNFMIKAYIMKFCTDEHLTGRILRKET